LALIPVPRFTGVPALIDNKGAQVLAWCVVDDGNLAGALLLESTAKALGLDFGKAIGTLGLGGAPVPILGHCVLALTIASDAVARPAYIVPNNAIPIAGCSLLLSADDAEALRLSRSPSRTFSVDGHVLNTSDNLTLTKPALPTVTASPIAAAVPIITANVLATGKVATKAKPSPAATPPAASPSLGGAPSLANKPIQAPKGAATPKPPAAEAPPGATAADASAIKFLTSGAAIQPAAKPKVPPSIAETATEDIGNNPVPGLNLKFEQDSTTKKVIELNGMTVSYTVGVNPEIKQHHYDRIHSILKDYEAQF
jgi:hypothetical protein